VAKKKRASSRAVIGLLDVLGRRWALRILWELRDGPLTFRALRAASGNLSPTVLNARLGELRQAGMVEQTESGYAMSVAGLELAPTLLALNEWAERNRRLL